MAASTSSSSSVVGLIPTRPLVFIDFKQEDVGKSLISFLEPVIKNENVTVLIDEEEVRDGDLENLFQRIQDTRISLAIFSESKCGFDELPKIKEPVVEGMTIFCKMDVISFKKLKGDMADLQNRSFFVSSVLGQKHFLVLSCMILDFGFVFGNIDVKIGPARSDPDFQMLC